MFPLPHLTSISKWHNSFKTSQEIACHLSRLTLKLMSRATMCYCIKRSDITFRVTNKLNATDSMAIGWRGVELFQSKLRWIVQWVGSWEASELLTLTAADPSPKPETTKGIRTSCNKELKQLSIWGTAIRSHCQQFPGFISSHSPFLLLMCICMHFGLLATFFLWCDWKVHLIG